MINLKRMRINYLLPPSGTTLRNIVLLVNLLSLLEWSMPSSFLIPRPDDLPAIYL